MKKSYFIKMFNLFQYLLILLFGAELTSIILNSLKKIEVILNSQSYKLITKFEQMLLTVSMITIILIFLIIFIEIFIRNRSDSIMNLAKSIISTYRFRRFFIQHEDVQYKNIKTLNLNKNKILKDFNLAVRKSVLDIRNNELLLFVKIPKGVQAQKLFKTYEEEIKEHISSLYPDYLISTYQRDKFALWLVGTKK